MVTQAIDDVLESLRRRGVPSAVIDAQTPWIRWVLAERASADVVVELIVSEQDWLDGPTLVLAPWKLAGSLHEHRELAQDGQYRHRLADDDTRIEAIGRMLSRTGLRGDKLVADLLSLVVPMMDVGTSNKDIAAEILALGSDPDDEPGQL